MMIQPGDKVVLIGDSITDAGRRSDDEGLGDGYVRMFHDLLHATRPELGAIIVNRGVSGDTIRHLKARWDTDVIAEAPDVLSISIGVNDVWRQLQDPPNPEAVPIDEYEATYRELLDAVRDTAKPRLILCEATIIGESRADPHNPIVAKYNDVVRRLAAEYRAVLAPMNKAYWDVIDEAPDRSWTSDGVHPLSHGHMLMAWTLYKAIGGLDRWTHRPVET